MSTAIGAANVILREIDKSQPAKPSITGIPVGVVGTAQKGPAYVPVTVGTYSDFKSVFGGSDGTKFGPIAAYSYLDSNSNSLTYLRLLGVGDGLKRNDTGTVTSAGFVVGERQPNSSGVGVDNNYAVTGGPTGRTYFLGCFMSESNGSTFFSDAGLQTGNTAVPVVRGVLLVASGVIARLSSTLGSAGDNSAPATGTAAAEATSKGKHLGTVKLTSSSEQFVLLLNGLKSNNVVSASFSPTSQNYFANVLNTDPLLFEEKGHYLYTHFDVHDSVAVVTGSGILNAGYNADASNGFELSAFLVTGSMPRNAGTTSIPNYENFETRFSSAKTPWLISQTFAGKKYDLFRLHYNSDGEINPLDQVKFTIENLKPADSVNKFGRFDLVVRSIRNTDADLKVTEAFRGLSLDPSDKGYIGKVIGDLRMYFDFDQPVNAQKLVLEGETTNKSNYIRVEVHPDVIDGVVPQGVLPVGFRGPSHLVVSGSALSVATLSAGSHITSVGSILSKVVEPPVPFRKNIVKGTGNAAIASSDYTWGVQFEHPQSATQPNASKLYNTGIAGYTRFYPDFKLDTMNFAVGNNAGVASDSTVGVLDSDLYNNNLFTLERVQVVTGSDGLADPASWVSATYVRAGNIVADNSNKTRAWNVSDLTDLNRKFAKFSFFAQGGFNGVNIFHSDEAGITNAAVEADYNVGINGPSIMSYTKAIDVMKNTSEVDIQLLSVPGLRNQYATNYILNAVKDRFDCLYLMDIEQMDETSNQILSGSKSVNVTNTAQNFTNRSLDNSFGAAYFPDVIVNDPDISGASIKVPPSAAVLRAFAVNDRNGQPWFAPAGYNRAVLNQPGAIPATGALQEGQLDILYNARINPIKLETTGRGPVVWGQKTLQLANTSLNRINVRRLLISLRREVRLIANRFIFEPNRESTLARFSSLVEPVLQRIQAQNGVSEYSVRIDTTTTTQQDIENNTIRGKIFVVPINSVEFISVDFEITNNIQ